jgi:uncharacterized DUF497 family protein
MLKCTQNVHTLVMKVEWDPKKAAVNQKKHGIDFADAAVALEDDNALTIEDESRGEQRFKTLALGPNLNVLLVIHAQRDADTIRIISARKADRAEKRQYYRVSGYERRFQQR